MERHGVAPETRVPCFQLRESAPDLETPPLQQLRSRLPSVHEVLYLLFNEGYLSSQAESAIRRELCDEAIRLATLLAEHPVGETAETFALLALMHLHVARFAARIDGSGGLLLLEEQDRSLWNQEQMRVGAEHCFAPSFRETRWQEIAELYATLERTAPSPLHHHRERALAAAPTDAVRNVLARRLAAPSDLPN